MAELHLRDDGDPAAPPIMFVNSLGTDLSMWQAQADALVPDHRVLRYDQRGHGQSPAPPGPYSIEDLGSDALGVLDRLEIERCSLAGISLGGSVAMWVAIEAPGRVEDLILCCTAASFGPPEPWYERIELVRSEGLGPVADQAIERWFTSEFAEREPGTVARMREGLLASDPDGYVACCATLAELDLRGRLGEIRAPTAVVAAPHDPATPPELLEEVAGGIEGAELTVLDDGAHLANIECATDVNEILRKHLSKEAA